MGIRVILILVALATAAGATVVAMAGAGTASGRSSARVFTLLAPPGGTSTAIDLGKHGMSPGDEFLTTDSPLRNPTSHRRVGRADIIETAMSESRSRFR